MSKKYDQKTQTYKFGEQNVELKLKNSISDRIVLMT